MLRVIVLLLSLLSLDSEGKELKFVGQESPPFNSTVAGSYDGAMVEVARTICARLAYRCTFNSVPLLRALAESRTGRVDAVLGLLYNDERSSFLTFSNPIVVARVAFLGNPGANPVRSESDLDGYTVAAVRGSTTLRMLQDKASRLPKMRVIAETDIVTAVQKLRAGRYGEKGVIFGTEVMLESIAAALTIPTAPVLIAEKQEFRIGFSKVLEPAVVADFNSELQQLRKSGELARIAKKYGLDVE